MEDWCSKEVWSDPIHPKGHFYSRLAEEVVKCHARLETKRKAEQELLGRKDEPGAHSWLNRNRGGEWRNHGGPDGRGRHSASGRGRRGYGKFFKGRGRPY